MNWRECATSETDLSETADVMENVKTLEGVLVKATEVGLEDSESATVLPPSWMAELATTGKRSGP